MLSENDAVLIEELRVSEEELRVQADELAEAQRLADRERERYQHLFDHAPIPYLVTDAAGNIRRANRAAAALLACRGDRLVGKPLAAFIPLGARGRFRQELQRITGAREVSTVTLRLTPREGGEKIVTGSLGVVEEDGEISELRWLFAAGPTHSGGAGGAGLDRHLRDLSEERAKAEARAREMGDLLAWASHELRTPVASIGGYSDILALGVRGMLTPDQQAVLVRIQQAQAHLVTLLDDLVTFARAGTGHLRYDIAPIRLEPIMERLTAIVEPQAAARDLRLAIDVPGSVTVRADGERVLQILLNLVTNSVKFTPAGGSISLACDPEPDTAVLRVSDSGSGVPEHARERIFRPYVQLDAPVDSRVRGAGLGLAISRELARAMGGDLTCTEAREGGSVFMLRLPRSTGIAATASSP